MKADISTAPVGAFLGGGGTLPWVMVLVPEMPEGQRQATGMASQAGRDWGSDGRGAGRDCSLSRPSTEGQRLPRPCSSLHSQRD